MMNLTRRHAASGMTFLIYCCTRLLRLHLHGTHQDVGIVSVLTGATVVVDDVQKGMRPLIAKLTRKDDHLVRRSLPGYELFDLTLTRGVSGWVWGKIAFGGLIGLVVDAIDGGMYELTPEQLSADLSSSHASLRRSEVGL